MTLPDRVVVVSCQSGNREMQSEGFIISAGLIRPVGVGLYRRMNEVTSLKFEIPGRMVNAARTDARNQASRGDGSNTVWHGMRSPALFGP